MKHVLSYVFFVVTILLIATGLYAIYPPILPALQLLHCDTTVAVTLENPLGYVAPTCGWPFPSIQVGATLTSPTCVDCYVPAQYRINPTGFVADLFFWGAIALIWYYFVCRKVRF
jgi:hypothetical protein